MGSISRQRSASSSQTSEILGCSGVLPPSASRSQSSHIIPAAPTRNCSPSRTSGLGKSVATDDLSTSRRTMPHAASRSVLLAMDAPNGSSADIGFENFGERTPLPMPSEILASECLILRAAPDVGIQTSVPCRSKGPEGIPSNNAPAT